ncbi:hypothetical protein [Rheinheimera sp.]|uniref:hypothetical protein n=1 Tax=Rheinheimera sp. TaxID=1869214 RepID=UPI0040473244
MSFDTQKEQARRQSEPNYWYNKSCDLRAAAGAVYFCIESQEQKHFDPTESLGLGTNFDMRIATWPVYLMLCGLSLETMFKATIVAKKGTAKLENDLRSLAEQSSSCFTSQQKELFEILTQCILWYGKYPAPNAKKHNSLQSLDLLATEQLTEVIPPRTPARN